MERQTQATVKLESELNGLELSLVIQAGELIIVTCPQNQICFRFVTPAFSPVPSKCERQVPSVNYWARMRAFTLLQETKTGGGGGAVTTTGVAQDIQKDHLGTGKVAASIPGPY